MRFDVAIHDEFPLIGKGRRHLLRHLFDNGPFPVKARDVITLGEKILGVLDVEHPLLRARLRIHPIHVDLVNGID